MIATGDGAGLLLGSAVQALVPVHLVARVLGRPDFGSVAAGGLLAVPLRLELGVVIVFGLGWLASRLVTPQEARVADDPPSAARAAAARGGHHVSAA